MNICCSHAHELDCDNCGSCDKEQMSETIVRLRERKSKTTAWKVSNRETDEYYERELKKFDKE